jgi:isoamylase
MNYWKTEEGVPFPFGVSWNPDKKGFNFALYSKNATAVTLHFFGLNDFKVPIKSFAFDRLVNKTERTWHAFFAAADLQGVVYYAYEVDGPFAPEQGDRFDRQKLLLDPYAKGVFFPPDFSRLMAAGSGSNAGKAPLGVFWPVHDDFDWGDDSRPRHSSDLIIYEMHVRGFTERDDSIEMSKRGCYAGVIAKIPYLQELGVTAVELLPVHQFDPQESNYWGYMTLNFFSPHHLYSADPTSGRQITEFKQMVKALHAAGIEVILDVVYNHTTEKDASGPTYCYRGIDNSTYYLLRSDMHVYNDDTGTGNVMRAAHPQTRKLVLDSLRYWVQEMHIDGFRFDLASIFTRNDDGSINLTNPPIISDITSDPVLASVRLIGEVWDVASYQLGRAFPGIDWAQWNGKFRDDIRRFVKGDSGFVATLMTRLYGSSDLYTSELPFSYRPFQSINFVTAHDGFCLYDLVSYNNKHNEQNGENNRDGSDANFSWNCGWEGDLNAPADVLGLRKRQIKNFFCLLMLANGTPMFCMGDEFMNTQRGNNNPYNQDNETTWLDWNRRNSNSDMFRFFQMMIRFRRTHPSIARGRFWREDVSWCGVGKEVDFSFDSHTLAYCLRGASVSDKDIYVMINAYWGPLAFTVQERKPQDWRRIIDTSLDSPRDILPDDQAQPLQAAQYSVAPRSVVVLVA